MIEFPFFNMQQLNLDWIIDKIKGMLSFLPDNGSVGQILRRTDTGAEWSDSGVGVLKSALNFVTDSIETGAPVNYIDGTFTGTGYAELQKSLKAGTYKYSLDGVTSSDTDTSVSCIDFYSGSTKKATIAVYRNVASSGTVNIPADVDVVYFYASDNYSHSTGDTFTYSNFALFKNNKLADDIAGLAEQDNVINGNIKETEYSITNAYKIPINQWVNKQINDTTGQIGTSTDIKHASTQNIINVMGYNKALIVTGISDLAGVKVYKYGYDGEYKGYNWGTSIVSFVYNIPEDVYGIRITYIKETAIDVSEIGTITLYREFLAYSNLFAKKCIYDGDSIAESRLTDYANGGAYPKMIADLTGGSYVNLAVGGGHLSSTRNNPYYPHPEVHSVYDNLSNLPLNGDLYCFEGGINDYWANIPLGTVDDDDYTGLLDGNTVAGALESIFRYSLNSFIGKPIIFVIVHKIQMTFATPNSNGDTFADFHDLFVRICNKYSIPYYDAFLHSGLNGWNTLQSNAYLTAGVQGADGTHPNEAGYARYYVPQLIDLFSSYMKY